MSTRPTPTQVDLPAFDQTLDVRPLNCPLPILRTKAMFAGMQPGDVLKVLYQQKEYVRELEMFTRQTGNEVIHTEDLGDHHAAWLRKV